MKYYKVLSVCRMCKKRFVVTEGAKSKKISKYILRIYCPSCCKKYYLGGEKHAKKSKKSKKAKKRRKTKKRRKA